MTKRGWKTAGEIVAELERNPEFVAHRAEQERRRQQIEDALRELEAPLVEALGQVGEHVKSVWDLVNTSRPYPLAIDVLLEHLQRPYPEQILEGIARALAVPESRRIWPDLVGLYRAHKATPIFGVKNAWDARSSALPMKASSTTSSH